MYRSPLLTFTTRKDKRQVANDSNICFLLDYDHELFGRKSSHAMKILRRLLSHPHLKTLRVRSDSEHYL